MNLADAQPGVFKMNLDAHLVCHLATTEETWVHDKPESKNPSIYNIIRWVAWTMGQINCRPGVMFQVLFFFILISIYLLISL